MKRPTIRLQPWVWKTEDEETPGYLIRGMHGRVAGHLTAAEARQLADDLHDIADELETPAA